MNKSKKKQQLDMQTLKRLLSYLKQYKARFIFVLICILVSAGASVLAALFLDVYKRQVHSRCLQAASVCRQTQPGFGG